MDEILRESGERESERERKWRESLILLHQRIITTITVDNIPNLGRKWREQWALSLILLHQRTINTDTIL